MTFDYEQDLQISPDSLDVEFLRQPALYMKYAEESAKAKDRLARAKETLEVTRAEIDKAIRLTPSEYGVEKVTEGAITSTLLQLPQYQNANEAYLKAKYEADLLQAAVIAMDQKKSSLEQLARLTVAGYCAMPSEPRDLGTAWRERTDARQEKQVTETRSEIKERLNIRTRRG